MVPVPEAALSLSQRQMQDCRDFTPKRPRCQGWGGKLEGGRLSLLSWTDQGQEPSCDGGVDFSLEHSGLLIHAIQPLGYAEPELFALSLGETTDENLMALTLLLENEWRKR